MPASIYPNRLSQFNMKTTPSHTTIMPFAFAKRHGVLVEGIENGTAKVIYHDKPHAAILAEIRRHVDMPLELVEVNPETFSKRLVKTYETDSSLAMQMAEDMG